MEIRVGKVIDLNDDGQGVIKDGGKVYFVSDALLGEEVEFEVTKELSKFAFAKQTRVLKPSNDRIKSSCPYYPECGGCDFQHLKYAAQLEFKRQKVRRALKDMKCDVQPCVSSTELGYRNKIVLSIFNGKCALKKSKSLECVNIESCAICGEWINGIISKTNEYLSMKKDNGLTELSARKVGESVIITAYINNRLVDENLFKRLFSSLETIKSIYTVQNKKQTLIYGEKMIWGESMNVRYPVSCESFVQVNDEIKEKLYAFVCEFIKCDVVFDAYSGAGLMTGAIARKIKQVYGIEIFKPAHDDAQTLKAENKIDNMINVLGDCKTALPKLIKQVEGKWAVVLDPPRAGCDKSVLTSLLELTPKQVIYVSCNPQSLKRDISILASKFDVKEILPFDMFPQTSHVETLVCLELKQSI